MADPPKRYYWDACAWIGLVNEESDKFRDLKGIWEAARAGSCELWTSAYTYIEVHKAKAGGGDPYPPEESDRRIDGMLEQPYVKIIQVDSEVARLARKLRRSYATELKKKADAIHLSSAIYWNVDELHTYDGCDLIVLNGRIQRLDGRNLPICVPNPLSGAPLFDRPKSDR